MGLAAELLANAYSHARLNTLFLRHELEERFDPQGMSPTKVERATRVLIGANSPERVARILSMLGEVVQLDGIEQDPNRSALLDSLGKDGFELSGNAFVMSDGEELPALPHTRATPRKVAPLPLVPPPSEPNLGQTRRSEAARPKEEDERSYALANLGEILQSFPDVPSFASRLCWTIGRRPISPYLVEFRMRAAILWIRLPEARSASTSLCRHLIPLALLGMAVRR